MQKRQLQFILCVSPLVLKNNFRFIVMKNLNVLFLIIPFLCLQCKKENEKINLPNEESAIYEVTFNIDWNAEEFPINYPSNAHFSKLIGWSHSPNSSFFALESMASEGIQKMAELGATSPLSDEINQKINDGEGHELIIGESLGSGVGKITLDVNVLKKHPSITLATMIAPSPDWYLAVVNINLLENEAFVNEKIVNALLYDAGTDSGADYTSSNAITIPQESISQLSYAPLSNGKVLSTVTFRKK
ncbi:MAG: hypothetical protein CMP67_00985 [Flavobacteriales bacterium]|nr:hypothetical protein [Flavobacteriales bacterium]MBO72054.1 hypothetical protein [Flavobacteriales bacterium]|tara:strand:+ start:206 stop:943 length:738 start_codon:yes stop_codon:yes gene_type:complete